MPRSCLRTVNSRMNITALLPKQQSPGGATNRGFCYTLIGRLQNAFRSEVRKASARETARTHARPKVSRQSDSTDGRKRRFRRANAWHSNGVFGADGMVVYVRIHERRQPTPTL